MFLESKNDGKVFCSMYIVIIVTKVFRENGFISFRFVLNRLQDFANYFHEEPKPGEENLPCGGDAIRKRTT